MEFMGFKREGRRAGLRNYVAVLPTIECGNEPSFNLAKKLPDVVALRHNFSCGYMGKDKELAIKTLVALGSNPNVYGVVVFGLGCEPVPAEEIAGKINGAGGNAYYVSISEDTTYEEAMEEAETILRRLLDEAARQERVPCDISELTVAVRCGGSGAVSAISSNYACGIAVDMLIDEGATVLFSETPELIGCADRVAERAVSQQVAEKLYEAVDRAKAKITAAGVDILGSEPSPGNIKQGLTTIEEKSLGAIIKSGTRPLRDVLQYGEKCEGGPGLYFVDAPTHSSVLFLGMICAGAQVQIFSYGGGFPARSRNLDNFPSNLKIYPVIKIMGSIDDDVAKPYFDVYADSILKGEQTAAEVGRALHDKIIAVASGESTFIEKNIEYSEMLQFYSNGLNV